MADDKKKPVIVIKKIYESPAGAHGGAWKVAFADFMTAMMCFFLVMWLLNQTEEVKKQLRPTSRAQVFWNKTLNPTGPS